MGVPIIYDKPFLTYDELLTHLHDDYGLKIESEEGKYTKITIKIPKNSFLLSSLPVISCPPRIIDFLSFCLL